MEQEQNNTPEENVEVVDIQFRPGQKIYYFDPDGKTFQPGEHVIIDTARGAEYGTCAGANHRIAQKDVVAPLRKVLRKANAQDERIAADNRAKEKKAYNICVEKIAEHGLDMQLVSAEVAFDGSKILFYFTADERVDFRELVKNLASIFHTRIELRQIGVRDKAKMVGGLGICGRPFCCSRFIDEFQPVSTKMAKMQSMSLNPSKISGSCGRLMCCLRYEQEAYEDLVKSVPKQGAFVETPAGYGTVTQVNLLRQLVKVKLDGEGDDTVRTYRSVEVAAVPGGRPKDGETPPSVLKYVPEPEEEEEPENEWELPELLINGAPEEPDMQLESRGRSRRSRRSGKKRGDSKAAEEKKEPVASAKSGTEEKKSVKPKPRQRRGNGRKPSAGGQAVKQEARPAERSEKPRQAQPDKAGAEKKKHGRRRYYHHGKPKNKQGGEAPRQ